jgi:hypothetical protein
LAAASTIAVPAWLARRGGAIQPGVQPETRFVLIDGQPLYKLEVRPAAGRYSCPATETASGRRLDSAATHGSFDEALGGGLEQLREKLGW